MYGNKQSSNSKFFYHNYGEERLQLLSMSLLSAEGYALRYDDSSSMLAIGCSEGFRALFSVDQGKFISQTHSDNRIGVTCLRWRPQVHSKNKVLLISDSDSVTQYLAPGNTQRWRHLEQKNSILCLDYSPDGKLFATAGKDKHIRIYDEQNKKLTQTLLPAEDNYLGHSNRIFALKFVDDNTIISGGWDAMVNIWDIRAQKCVKYLTGPHISGDAIDFQDGQILTGSHNSINPLQVWDFGTTKLIQNLEWAGFQGENPRIFTAKFSTFDKGTVAAGCSGTNQFKLFRSDGTEFKPINKISYLKGGCYSMDFHPGKKQFAFADSSGNLCIFAYDVK